MMRLEGFSVGLYLFNFSPEWVRRQNQSRLNLLNVMNSEFMMRRVHIAPNYFHTFFVSIRLLLFSYVVAKNHV
jgi:hypothetical protein